MIIPRLSRIARLASRLDVGYDAARGVITVREVVVPHGKAIARQTLRGSRADASRRAGNERPPCPAPGRACLD